MTAEELAEKSTSRLINRSRTVGDRLNAGLVNINSRAAMVEVNAEMIASQVQTTYFTKIETKKLVKAIKTALVSLAKTKGWTVAEKDIPLFVQCDRELSDKIGTLLKGKLRFSAGELVETTKPSQGDGE
jgi:hypothetical protein